MIDQSPFNNATKPFLAHLLQQQARICEATYGHTHSYLFKMIFLSIVFTMKKLIVIGVSTGGLGALKSILATFPPGFPAAVLVVIHIGNRESYLPDVLACDSALTLRHGTNGEPLKSARVLFAPPDRHMLVVADQGPPRVVLSYGPKENHTRPAIDPLFRSAAQAYGSQVIGVVLTGYLDDGTAGLKAIKACGGMAIVQDPADALASSMPTSAVENVEVDLVLPVHEIGPTLTRIVLASEITDDKLSAASIPEQVPEWVRVENRIALGSGDMDDLATIATPSTFSCPECQGVLWELHGQTQKRLSCHTGHSFTADLLSEDQNQVVEDALWAAVRALHEKEQFSSMLAANAVSHGHDRAARDYEAQAQLAQDQAKTLLDLLER
jgi:two-component system chemotaxis response regulator CheB